MNSKLRSFLRGFASAFDLFGVIGPEPPKFSQPTHRSASEALQSDWQAVMGDLDRAIYLDQDSREAYFRARDGGRKRKRR